MNLSQKDVERFQSGVNRLNPDDCWFWQRSCNEDGYGYFYLNGKMEKTHRVSWFLANGLIPELFEGLPSMICHYCDNPSCCNPNHLFLGNNEVNMKDCAFKGRSTGSAGKLKGVNHPNVLKTEVEIKAIKQDLQEGALTHKQVGLRYGIARQTVTNIKSGKTWSHINV